MSEKINSKLTGDAELEFPNFNELPEIELYMDQVISYTEKLIQPFSCSPEEKLITSSIVNNYVKKGVINRPVNKKYSKEHLAPLIGLCILKQSFNLSTMSEFTKEYMPPNRIEEAYDAFVTYQKEVLQQVEKDMTDENKERLALKLMLLANTYKLAAERIISELTD